MFMALINPFAGNFLPYSNLLFFGAGTNMGAYTSVHMKHPIHLIVFAMAVFCLAAGASEQPVVRVGDSVIAVRNHLGEPKIEFPLHGQLIQDYGHCIIISKNGLVVSIKKLVDSSLEDEPPTEESKAAAVAGLLLKQAEEGDAIAQFRLAYCYQTGDGVPRNPDECVRWYTLAAMNGHPASQHNLGFLYMTGDGVEKDYEQAYTWGVLAAENGNNALLKKLLPRLTDKQERSGRLRAWRIRDGLEPLPYGTPDDSTAVAKQNSPQSSASTEN
jgi:hypothetical protein